MSSKPEGQTAPRGEKTATAVGLAMERDFAGRQSVGARTEQQDSYGFSVGDGENENSAKNLLLTLADGMGGHFGGSAASENAVMHFIGSFEGQKSGAPGERLLKALQEANASLGRLCEMDRSLSDAGTTLLAVLVKDMGAFWVSVGDSPLFLYRTRKLRRLNADHSMRAVLAKKVEQGEMRARDAEKHPDRGVLLSALVGEEPEMVDVRKDAFPLERGDVLLACSDGLLTLSEEEVSSVLGSSEKEKATAADTAKALLAKVAQKQHRAQDNTTVCLIKIPEKNVPAELRKT